GKPGGNPKALYDRGVVPLRPGDWVQFEVTVKPRPAYVYLVRLESQGQAVPLYPWPDGNWADRGQEQAVEHLELPEDVTKAAPLPDGPPGVEAILLLVRDEPAPADVDWKGLFAGLHAQGDLTEREQLAWLENGKVAQQKDLRKAANLAGAARLEEHPVLAT